MSWYWPFGTKEKLETRATQPYSDIILKALEASAAGTGSGDALKIAVVEAAAGQYARAFAGCEVKSERYKYALTPSVLSTIARNMIRYGEDVHVIHVLDGELILTPAGSWDVTGNHFESSWVYNVHMYSPSGSLSSYLPSDGVIHCRYSYDSSRPWNGIGPLGWCSSSGKLASNLEEKLSDEAGASVGFVVPLPRDAAPGTEETPGVYDALRKDIANLKGKHAIVETTAYGHGEGKQAAPMGDWKPQRLGADPPTTLATLRSDAGQSLLAACGCPPGLFTTDGSAQGSREAWRRFIFGSCEPIARLIEEELSKKLETEISLSFNNMFAADIAARSTAFKKLVEGGMDVEKAVGVSGLMSLEV